MQRCRAVITAVLVLAPLLFGGGHVARADTGDEPQYADFYTPAGSAATGPPGDLIRTEPSRLVLEPSGQLGAIMATGTRIMYRSTDARGNPIAVTGTYFEPYNAWPGKGPRPLISYAPGTQGQGNQCAPSRMFNQGIHYSGGWDIMFNYEELFVATMVARGFAIVMTDYEGLGTPSMHTYVGRVAGGPGRARCGPRGDAPAGHLVGSPRAGGVLGLLAGRRGDGLGGRAGFVLRTRTAYRRAPMPGRRRPTSRNFFPTPTAACWSASSDTHSTASWPPIRKPPTPFAPK